MPVTAILNMRAATGGKLPRSFHCLMHPVLLDILSKTDPAMAEEIHDGQFMSPFSLSPVMGVDRSVRENQSCWVRICFLDDRSETVFYRSLESGLWFEPIRLEKHVFIVEDVKLGLEPQNPWTGRESFEDLIGKSAKSQKMSLLMQSPMSFKRGDLHYPLPEPALIFGNLARRWNLVSPLKLPENPDCSSVSLSFVDIKTRPFALRKGGTIIGVTGKLSFVFKGDENEILYFNTLLRFGFYSGIGVKTAQGMGMVRAR